MTILRNIQRLILSLQEFFLTLTFDTRAGGRDVLLFFSPGETVRIVVMITIDNGNMS